MGGGLGMGSIKQSLTLLDRLDAVDSFTVVTGYNADLYDELSKMRSELHHDVNILGYTNRIPQLMCQASLLVTKPGALTCTEAAAVQVRWSFIVPSRARKKPCDVHAGQRLCPLGQEAGRPRFRRSGPVDTSR